MAGWPFGHRGSDARAVLASRSARRGGGIRAYTEPNLKPTWLAIIAGRARPDEPEVVGGVQEEGGVVSTPACGGVKPS